MIPPIILSSTNAAAALTAFNKSISTDNPETNPITVLLVLGTGSVADDAVAMADGLINSNDANYASSRVVHATNPSLILDALKALKVNPDMNAIEWDQFDQYVILSISNKFNNLAWIVLKSKFPNQPRGYINRIIRKAQAYDIQL